MYIPDPLNPDKPWSVQCIGSDFDGIVDPLDCFWTAQDMNALRTGLLYHAQKYHDYEITDVTVEQEERVFTAKSANGIVEVISAEKVIDKIMTDNAFEFIKYRFELPV